MAEGGCAKSAFKVTCLGCLGFAGIVAVAIAVVVGIAAMQARSEELETRDLTHGLPEAVEPALPAAGAPGRVILNMSHGALYIAPGAAGEPLRVKASYDARRYELTESFETEGQSAWTYRMEFHGTGSSLIQSLREMLGGTGPEIRVFLPPDAPIALEMEVNQAGSETELGGLWLTEADLAVHQGGLELSVGSPLRAPMERLSIEAAMGGITASALGNASPRKLDVKASMGGLELDLRGAWVTDSDIAIETRMGGAEVQLPEGVRIEGIAPARLEAGPEPELGRPTLRFHYDEEMGGIEFER